MFPTIMKYLSRGSKISKFTSTILMFPTIMKYLSHGSKISKFTTTILMFPTIMKYLLHGSKISTFTTTVLLFAEPEDAAGEERDREGDDAGSQYEMEVSVFPWHSLSKFQQLLLVRVLRSDILVAAMARFVQGQLGEKYVTTGAFDLKEVYEGSTARSPLIFILSPGGCRVDSAGSEVCVRLMLVWAVWINSCVTIHWVLFLVLRNLCQMYCLYFDWGMYMYM